MNSFVGMTKDAYFEMCEALGTEPIENEIPVELSELPLEVQQTLDIYFKMRDEWDTMNGRYLGKSYAGILDLFNIVGIEPVDHRMTYDLLTIMDTHRATAIRVNKPQETNKKPTKP
jgi:hypothetical protein